MTGLLANWTRLVGLIVRRDRWVLPVWILACWAFCVGMAPMMPGLYSTPEELAASTAMMGNPALVAMCGLVYKDPANLGTTYTQMMLVWSGLLVALMNILVVIRHTRTDEDEGRVEVIRSLPTGRLASLAAIAAVIVAVDVVLALACGFGLAAFRIESMDLAGSLVYGAALGACGLVFAALALVVIQLTDSARTATAWTLALLGGLYVLRAYGDVSSETAARVSPLGLIQRTYAFDTNRWWPIAVLAVIAACLFALAFAGNARRDPGAGLLPQLRRGRAHAPAWMRSEWGLAVRLTRPGMIGWGAAVFLLSAAYGTVMPTMQDYIRSNAMYQQMTGADPTGDLTGSIVVTLMLLMAIVTAIPVLNTANRLVGEEHRGRMDYVLGRTVSRTSLFAGYAVLSVATAVGLQLLTAGGFWLVAAAVMTTPVKASLVFGIAFNYLAALLAFAGLGLFLAGAAKHLTWIGWGYLGVTFLVVYLGGVMNVSRLAQRFTPMGLLQRYPSETFSWWPWVALVVVGAALGVAGLVAYRRRDVTA